MGKQREVTTPQFTAAEKLRIANEASALLQAPVFKLAVQMTDQHYYQLWSNCLPGHVQEMSEIRRQSNSLYELCNILQRFIKEAQNIAAQAQASAGQGDDLYAN